MKDIEFLELKLIAYVPVHAHGFTLPLFGHSKQANTLYTAKCYPSGDHRGDIVDFIPIDVEKLIWLPKTKIRSARIGSRWLDVFVWGKKAFVGDPDRLWNKLLPYQTQLKCHAPLSLLDLAINADRPERLDLMENARRFVEENHGRRLADRWSADVFTRNFENSLSIYSPTEMRQTYGWPPPSQDIEHRNRLDLRGTPILSGDNEPYVSAPDLLRSAETLGINTPTANNAIQRSNLTSGPFQSGDYVVYPSHGVGKVIGRESHEIGGYSLDMVAIGFSRGNMTLRVPFHRASSDLRLVATTTEFNRAMKALEGAPNTKLSRGKRARRERHVKATAGTPAQIAEVLRDLHAMRISGTLDPSDLSLYDTAADRLANEFAIVEAITPEEAWARLNAVLQNGVGRRLRI